MERLGRRMIVAGIIAMALFAPLAGAERLLTLNGTAALTFCSVACWIAIGVMLWRRRQAGAVLLHLERPASVRVMAALVSLFLAGCLLSLLALHQPLQALYQLSVGALVLVWASNGVQMRTRGLALRSGFIPWAQIVSYSIADDFDVVDNLAVTNHVELSVQFRRRWGLEPFRLGSATVHCPVTKRSEAIHVMVERVPTRRGQKPLMEPT